MYAFVEEPTRARCDSAVQSLSWMGKAPDGQPEGGVAWKLSETSYYDDGWLASGNTRGVVGVTLTACRGGQNTTDQPPRTNFNLRGHRSEVILVRWNEPYQKLATCDVTGIIFVWIKHDGRWSIELINDRSSQVTDFAWSHDGQMALICYKDSFVLVGSVAGQRYWSSMLNLDGCLVTCGIWTPDDQKVMFGTTAGKVIVMSASGTMIAQVIIHEGLEITHLGWSSERFYLMDHDSDGPLNVEEIVPVVDGKPYVLSVALAIGDILLMSNYDDICPKVIHTGLAGVRMEWSNDGELLAVAGYVRLPNQDYRNELRFYRRSTKLQLSLVLPNQSRQPVTALTWGHNDRRVFVAVGSDVLTVCVLKRVASLQLLCGRRIQQRLTEDTFIYHLPLPNKLQAAIAELFTPTVKGYIPHVGRLREFVCTPPPRKERLHCTIIRHGDDTSGGYYTLYLEYLGGLIPLLKGKRASKLHPDFVIFDPQIKAPPTRQDDDGTTFTSNGETACDESDTDVGAFARSDGCNGSPSAQRRKRLCKLRDSLKCRDTVDIDRSNSDGDMYSDSLPEVLRLVEITSNIWGTKFRFTGLASFLPDDLGSVTYKTSLLHLQPRQMTVTIFELTSDLRPQTHDPDYNPNQFSESEDEPYALGYDLDPVELTAAYCDSAHSKLTGVDTDGCSCTVILEPSPSDIDRNLKLNTLGPQDCLNPSIVTSCPSRCPVPECLVSCDDPCVSPLHCSAREPCPARVSPTDPGPFLPLPSMVGAIDGNICLFPVSQLTVSSHCDSASSASSSGVSTLDTTCTMTYVPRAVEDPSTLAACERRASTTSSVTDGPTSSIASGSGTSSLPRWADRACEEIQYIDDDCDDKTDLYERQCSARDAVHCTAVGLSAREIMQSTQMLATSSEVRRSVVQIVRKVASEPTPERGVAHTSPVRVELTLRQRQSSPDTRCIACSHAAELAVVASMGTGRLSHSFSPTVRKSRSPGAELRHQTAKLREMARSALCHGGRQSEQVRRRNGKRRGLCGVAGPSIPQHSGEEAKSTDTSPHVSNPGSPAALHRPLNQRCGSLDVRHCEGCMAADTQVMAQSASLPASPVHKALGTNRQATATPLLGRSRLQSPLAARHRLCNNGNVGTNVADSSDDELMALSMDEVTTSENYRNLETFQKAQLSRKLRKVRTKCDQDSLTVVSSREPLLTPGTSVSPRHSPQHGASCTPNGSAAVRIASPAPSTRRRRFVMYNKAPMWNETSQVYQLDFGGRVTQESAKNFQIEFGGKQVMQFGRIDNNAYTLDFQYPYSAIQAFAVALANVTQRLK